MRARILSIAGSLVIASLLLSFPAPGKNSPAAPPVLPSEFGRWTQSPSNGKPAAPDFGSDDLRRAIFAEAGYSSSSSQSYTSGPNVIRATAYRFQDSSGAYEVFTFLRGADMHLFDSSLSHTGAFNQDRALVAAGNAVVELQPATGVSLGDLQDLLQRVAAVADKTPFPPIQTFLPKELRIAGTERYALGPAAFRAATSLFGQDAFAALSEPAGFSSGAEAMLARYKTGRAGGQEAVLLIIDYPTPQLAELHLHHLEGPMTSAAAAARQSATNIERKGSLLSMVLAPTSPEFAETVRNSVNYQTQVTWNEASQVATDPPITSTLVKIMVGTGVIMIIAVVLGVAFGGVRVLTKRFFPGKVFDRPEQLEILQLGLSGKPIDSSDMY